MRLQVTMWFLTYTDGRLCRPGAPGFPTCEAAVEYANGPVRQGRALMLWHGREQAATITPRWWGE